MNYKLSEEELRIFYLNVQIIEIFDDVSVSESEAQANACGKSETGMFEVRKMSADGCVLNDLDREIEIRPVLFPERILTYLREGDVFLATLGWRNSYWTVILMTPRYESEVVEIDLDF